MQPTIALHRSVPLCTPQCRPIPHQLQAGLYAQVKHFFQGLFDTADWPARWHCGTWTDFHGWLYIVSDLMIWAAYFAIPLLLYRIVANRKDLPFARIFWLFIAFILLCGTTHFFDAVIFWWPAYRLSALIRFVTGIVSIITVIALYRVLPLIQRLRTLEQLEAEIEVRKKAEQEARNQQMLQESTKELMRKKDEFMSIASHELKTPITSAKASLQIVERQVAANKELSPVLPMIERASKQVNKLTGIINDLLDVTKIQADRLDLNITSFKLVELIEESVLQCNPVDDRHPVEITGDKDLVVSADHHRMDQVLCNLLTNAVKYSPQGGLIQVSFEALANQDIKVSITDHGIGIAADKIQNIFDRFFRVENTSQNYAGLGLGLYITSEIVKQHKGVIGVESLPGAGSTFWFTLPQASAHSKVVDHTPSV